MRILQICSADALGGGEVHVIQLVEELRRRGHSVEIAGRRNGPLSLDHELAFSNSLDVPTAIRLRQIIRDRAFDIVHAHVARDYPLAAGALIGLRVPKLVVTRQLIHRVARNPLYRRVDLWIATTTRICQTLQHLNPRRTAVISNWTDTRHFAYAERPLRDPVVIGLLGQVSPHKGHDDAVRMIELLGAGFRLLFGGEGEAGYVDHLRARARNLPVEFLGFVDPRSLLEQIDVLILPSWEEPFGIVVLEAMASGVNVIATNAGGPPEILEFGESGVLVPPRNPQALATAVQQLVADRRLADDLRGHARQRVEDTYDIVRVVGKIENLYQQLSGEA